MFSKNNVGDIRGCSNMEYFEKISLVRSMEAVEAVAAVEHTPREGRL